jgi:hypothetical protein
MAVQGEMLDTEEMKYTANPVDDDGDKGTIDGVIAYRVVSGSGTFVADPDGMGAMLRSATLGAGVSSEVTVYEASVLAGGFPLVEVMTITVNKAVLAATELNGSLGAPRPKA